jgi:hypothetical protein
MDSIPVNGWLVRVEWFRLLKENPAARRIECRCTVVDKPVNGYGPTPLAALDNALMTVVLQWPEDNCMRCGKSVVYPGAVYCGEDACKRVEV